MTIDEAIEILEYNLAELTKGVDPDSERAFRLGISALKFFKDLEDRGALPPDARLPGETKE